MGLLSETRRQLSRPWRRVRRVVDAATGGPGRSLYDLRRKKHVQVRRGGQPVRDEIAIVLIYQPDGVLASTLFLLSWLCRQGISPVVVSNAPLPDSERDKLAPDSLMIVERPNVGYDFGGYREGVMTIAEQDITPKSLYILNDSIWFPLRETCDVIRHARDSDADLFGLFSNRIMSGDHQTYLQSYFFRFGERLLRSPDFMTYWRDLPLLNDKRVVVRKLERRLTAHFVGRGFTVDYMHDRQDMIDMLLGLDDAALEQAVRFMAETSAKDGRLLRPYLADAVDFAASRPQIERLIREGRVQTAFAFAHPDLLRLMGVPFLKKARNIAGRAQRRWLRTAGFAGDFAAPVRAEIEGWD